MSPLPSGEETSGSPRVCSPQFTQGHDQGRQRDRTSSGTGYATKPPGLSRKFSIKIIFDGILRFEFAILILTSRRSFEITLPDSMQRQMSSRKTLVLERLR